MIQKDLVHVLCVGVFLIGCVAHWTTA